MEKNKKLCFRIQFSIRGHQHKFAGQRKTRNAHSLELIGLQELISKHMHQKCIKENFGIPSFLSLVEEGNPAL
jgi:hypothetical protein